MLGGKPGGTDLGNLVPGRICFRVPPEKPEATTHYKESKADEEAIVCGLD